MRNTGHLPLIVAHRGSSYKAPENTIEAFSLAVRESADGIEFDVRLAGDGIPVVFHDPDLKRFTGTDTRLEDLSAKELGQVSVGKWFNNRYPKRARPHYERSFVPTLQQTLHLLEEYDGTVYVELKCRSTDFEETARKTADLLSDASNPGRFVVKSFNLDAIPLLRKEYPELRTAALFAPKVMSVIRKEKRLVNIASDLRADALSLHASLATKKLTKKARRAGLSVAIWTVDNPRWVKRAIELRIGTVITNRPDRLLLRRRELLHRNSITA